MTYYEVLNIKQTASAKDIKNAYRVLAKKYHPDTYEGNKSVAEEKMKQINEAYDVLSNKDLKDKYDEQFKVAKTEVKSEPAYQQSYYNYETEEYRSPDPRDADYRSYYNYSPDYEDEFYYKKDYDFTKLKILFEKSIIKFSLFIIFILIMLGIAIYMINQIKIQATTIFKPIEHVETPVIENVPENIYSDQNNTDRSQINTEELEKQLQELEKSFDEWYKTDGKEYEQQIKEGVDSLYQEFLNGINNN